MKQYWALRFFTFVLAFLSYGTVVHAQTDEVYSSVRIIPERTHVQAGDKITIASEITLEPEWHVYWRNPGDSGLPVQITWNDSEKYTFSDIEWPVPDKISYDILANYGYYNPVILLQTLEIPDDIPNTALTFQARYDLLVCNEICIPETHIAEFSLNGDTANQTDNRDFINKARTKMPKLLDGEFFFFDTENTLKMSIESKKNDFLVQNKEKISFFPFDWGITNTIDNTDVHYNEGIITLSHKRGDQSIIEKETLEGLVVIQNGYGQNEGFHITAQNGAMSNQSPPEIQADQKESIPEEPDQKSSTEKDIKLTLASAILFALLGGLVLNLMPCVFPVLSMKALSLLKMSEQENKKARQHGLAYATGVIISFITIGAALLALKSSGAAIGWGFQLQNPFIVGLLTYLLFLIGLNLLGVFNIRFGFENTGQHLTQRSGLSGSFFTGALATIVAAPCTAPFMGAALGFALTQSAAVNLGIFAALGIGLALPYVLLCYIPQLRTALPAPGAWMDTFKQFLSFPMFASVIWLVWVIAQQSSHYGVLLVLSGLLLLGFAIWIARLGVSRLMKGALIFVSTIISVVALAYMPHHGESQPVHFDMEENAHLYTPDNLEKLLSGNHPVFVEMTAAWCITCKFNNATSINVQSTKRTFAQNNVQYMVGDWTNQNPDITAYLEKFGRNGVPLYVFYGARSEKTNERPEPVLLPQILTPAIVQQSVENN